MLQTNVWTTSEMTLTKHIFAPDIILPYCTAGDSLQHTAGPGITAKTTWLK